MSDLHEIFERAKQREAEDEDAQRIYKPISLNKQGLNMIIDDQGRVVFESKKDACF